MEVQKRPESNATAKPRRARSIANKTTRHAGTRASSDAFTSRPLRGLRDFAVASFADPGARVCSTEPVRAEARTTNEEERLKLRMPRRPREGDHIPHVR